MIVGRQAAPEGLEQRLGQRPVRGVLAGTAPEGLEQRLGQRPVRGALACRTTERPVTTLAPSA